MEANQDQMESAFQQVRVVSEMKEKHGSGSTTCSPWGVTQTSEVGVGCHLRAPAVQAHLHGGKEEVSGSAGTTSPIPLCHQDGDVLWVAGRGGPPSPRPPPCPLPPQPPLHSHSATQGAARAWEGPLRRRCLEETPLLPTPPQTAPVQGLRVLHQLQDLARAQGLPVTPFPDL